MSRHEIIYSVLIKFLATSPLTGCYWWYKIGKFLEGNMAGCFKSFKNINSLCPTNSILGINVQEITMVYKMIYVSGYPFHCSIIMVVKNWKPPKCQQ